MQHIHTHIYNCVLMHLHCIYHTKENEYVTEFIVVTGDVFWSLSSGTVNRWRFLTTSVTYSSHNHISCTSYHYCTYTAQYSQLTAMVSLYNRPSWDVSYVVLNLNKVQFAHKMSEVNKDIFLDCNW